MSEFWYDVDLEKEKTRFLAARKAITKPTIVKKIENNRIRIYLESKADLDLFVSVFTKVDQVPESKPVVETKVLPKPVESKPVPVEPTVEIKVPELIIEVKVPEPVDEIMPEPKQPEKIPEPIKTVPEIIPEPIKEVEIPVVEESKEVTLVLVKLTDSE